MRICLVTAFPPSTQRLNEYGLHLAEQVRAQHGTLTVLADQYQPTDAELDGFQVERCWRFNDLFTPFRILAAVRRLRPDVVWFNLVYSTFGDQPLAAFFGLCTPALLRLAGYRTQVTLHHLMENVELRHADIRFPKLYLLAGTLATRMLLKADRVSVLLDGYKQVLEQRYGAKNINVRRHGILGAAPCPPDFELRNEEFRILAFGKFGRYKRLEVMLEAFPEVRRQIPNAKLIIAGQDHPNRPGYMDALARRYAADPGMRFLGYVPENEIAGLFSRCSVAVLPYSSSGGPSGVAHMAARFGLPIIAPPIGDILNVASEEHLVVDYYQTDDAADLAEKIIALAQDPQRQRQMAEHNYTAAMALTMPAIVQEYLKDFRETSEAEPQAGAASLPQEAGGGLSPAPEARHT